MSYQRVLPRDLFNEAKLLKSLGQVALLIHDERAPRGLTFLHCDEPGFEIEQDQSTGDLFCMNLRLFYRPAEVSHEVWVDGRYNSKAPYTLVARDSEDQCDVLTDEGEFTPEFLAYLRSLEES